MSDTEYREELEPWDVYVQRRIEDSLGQALSKNPGSTLNHLKGNVLGSIAISYEEGRVTKEQFEEAVSIVNQRNTCPGKMVRLVESEEHLLKTEVVDVKKEE